jgi:hypothetical protein
MTTKFEQLIEYVINDDTEKARELFHNIVVEKSREIYENLMNEEDGVEEDIDESEDMEEESMEEGMDDTSGSADEDLMREVEADESGGMNEEDDDDEEDDDFGGDDDDEEDDDFGGDDEDGEHDDEDLEDRVIDLEDKLDELMAEFEELMGDEAEEHGDDGEEGDDFDMEPKNDEVGGDAYTDDDTSEFKDMPMSENVSLDKVAPPKHGDNGANHRSPTTFNSGAAGMQGKPVRNVASETNPDGTSSYKAPTSYADKGRGDLPGAGKFKNVPAKGGANAKLEAAPKPHLAQASGVNTKTPFPKG